MNIHQYNLCVDQYSDGIYRFAVKQLNDKEWAADVVQDVFLAMWDKVSEVHFEKAKSYLFTSAYHRMVDMIRKKQYHEKFLQQVPKKSCEQPVYSDVQEILQQALMFLPENQRSVILLRDLEGYAYEEIGEITGLSESQVKVYIFRARSFLKNYIGKLENVL